MSSVGAVSNPGLNYLTQLLTSTGSPLLSSGLSSSQVQSVLQNASPEDIVQLSTQALQLQNIDNLFGVQDSTDSTQGLFSTPSSTSSSSLLDNLLASLTSGSGTGASQSASSSTSGASATAAGTSQSGSTSTESLASQMAGYQSQLQSEELQSLFGTSASATNSANLLNLLG